jgi:hypothetical protein
VRPEPSGYKARMSSKESSATSPAGRSNQLQCLLVQFDFHNGYLQGAVGKLLCDKHIKLDRTKNMVHITEAGYGLLQEMGYWSELSSSHGGSPLYWLSLQVASVMNQDLASVRKAEG